VAMAGDGINDAPRPGTGAGGHCDGSGTDVAMESAGQSPLIKGDLRALAKPVI